MRRPPLHPGDVLAEELAGLNVAVETLAEQINVPVGRIRQIVARRHRISADMALRLGHWFGTSAQFWINLQVAYDVWVAIMQAGEEIDRLPVRPGIKDVKIKEPVRSKGLAALLATWEPFEGDFTIESDPPTKEKDIF